MKYAALHLIKIKHFQLATLLVFILFSAATAFSQNYGMKMHVINVGQAESIVLEFKHQAILVDAGAEILAKSESNSQKDYRYRNNLAKYLKRFFEIRSDLDNTFYAVIISHPHPDHANHLLKEVLKKYKVLSLIESGDNLDNYGYVDEDFVQEKGITHYKLFDQQFLNQQNPLLEWQKKLFDESGAVIWFLDGWRSCYDENNFSLVMHVAYKNKSFLLTGDNELDDKKFGSDEQLCEGLIPVLLKRFQTKPQFLKADVYKAGHHGSRNGTSLDFLNIIRPDYSVISAGNYQDTQIGSYNAWSYGHPNEKSVREMEQRTNLTRATPITAFTMKGPHTPVTNRTIKKAIYCTCWDGSIIFTVNEAGDKITPTTELNN
jgi:competence protein ComEC